MKSEKMFLITSLILYIISIMMTSANIEVGETREISVSNGAVTLATLIGPASAPVKLVWGHGLGSSDPELRTRFNDKSSNSSYEGMEKANARLVCYDARGHGSSHGWEETAQEDQLQFSWPELAKDMVEVVKAYELEPGRVIVGGSSMGSATALYTALQHKDLVDGLILMRPPTAWEERVPRKAVIMESARRLQLEKPGSPYYNVLYGSAYSDLPPLESLQKVLNIPVLIVTAKGDGNHPVSTAEALSNLSDDLQLYIAETYSDGLKEFPDVIAEFLQRFK